MSIISKIFGDANQKYLNSVRPIIDKINAFEEAFIKLSNEELKNKTENFKKRLLAGETLDDILSEAFAVVRETAKRTLKQRHFDVQLVGGLALHQGKIAQMATGEGKTLTATLPVYLNALKNNVHIITVNDYLARRDTAWMGQIYDFLGLSVGCINSDGSFIYDPAHTEKEQDKARDETGGFKIIHEFLRPAGKLDVYGCDVIYGTNTEFGFDYLRDNLVADLSQIISPERSFAIVDEVDSILIDEARTPLIISMPDAESPKLYETFSRIVPRLKENEDYNVDLKMRTAVINDAGLNKVENILGIGNIYDEKGARYVHHLETALKAQALFHKDKDYVVKNGEIIIVDEFTGRLMMGRRYSEGLHQAIEAKEGVAIQQESQTLATISFQNYFRMYVKLSGMTGTAATEAEEFNKIYKLEVVVIPTNNPMIRVDHADTIYKTISAKYTAVAGLVEELHKKGQPVLIGTTSIEKNEFLSELLKRKGVSHALLNAKNHEKEAEIISHAGEKGAVTVATNMAGRGVDIVLSKGITELGGLFVIGTERHESRRIDNQLRGRSGRQGDPGESRFFVSLEDDLMRIFGGDQVSRVMDFLKMPEDTPIEHGLVSKAIEGAQKKVEGHNFDIRKNTVEYDDVMNQQRQIIYGVRKRVLEAAQKKDTSLKEEILEKVAGEIKNLVIIHSEEGLDVGKIVEEFSTIAPIDDQSKKDIESKISTLSDPSQISEFLTGLARNFYEQRENQVGIDVARQMEVFVYLNTIDTLWIEHLDTMDDLRSGIGLRGYAQRDPLIEYKREGFDLFEKLMVEVDYEIVHRIYKVALQQQAPLVQKEAVEEKHPEIEIGVETEKKEVKTGKAEEGGVTKVTIERGGQVIAQETYGGQGQLTKTHGKIGRNDPCYCGSGKKYKKCHYPN